MALGTDLIAAGDTLERLAMQYEGIYTASIALKGIGSLSNHLVELTAKRDELLKDLERITRDNEDAHDALEATRSTIEHEKDQAGLFAAVQKEIAQAEANEIISRANAAAAAVKANAEKEIAEKTAQLIKDQADSNEYLAFIAHEHTQAKSDLAVATAALTETLEQRQKLLNYLDVMRSMPVA